jgi:hypothetical protein
MLQLDERPVRRRVQLPLGATAVTVDAAEGEENSAVELHLQVSLISLSSTVNTHNRTMYCYALFQVALL